MNIAHIEDVNVSAAIRERRERVFLVLAGVFLASMTMLNILGITRFIQIGPLALAVGVLPYPLTFLCTDFISELYGRRRANFVVWVGVGLNLMVLGFLWLGQLIPGISEADRPPWQTLTFADPVVLPGSQVGVTQVDLFVILFRCTQASVLASMIAYLAAQFCDVALFHFLKNLTRGKHLWLRNNGSTMVSQLVDSTAVIFITFWVAFRNGDKSLHVMLVLVGSSYLFKLVVAALDTVPFYLGVRYLNRAWVE